MVKAKRKGTMAVAALAAAVALVFVLCRSAAVEAAYPVERAKASLFRRAWAVASGAWRGAAASAENVRLRREVASLAVLRTDLDRLEAENARLREALSLGLGPGAGWVAAQILSCGGGAAGSGRTVRVDRGTLHGVREGAVVVVPEGLVGLVTSATPHTAVVSLVTDPRVKASCEIELARREGDPPAPPRGILAGGTDEMLVLRHLSGADCVAPRARVVTSGLGGVFPKGIEVGTLLDVRRDEKGVVREGEVLPSVDYPSLEEVFIRREE